MTTFTADWFDGKTAKPRRVEVGFSDGGLTMREAGPGAGDPLRFKAGEYSILPPLGAGARVIRLPKGFGHVETQQSSAVDEIEKATGVNRRQKLLHLMESRWKLALAALAGLGIILALSARYLIPTAADAVAARLPDSVAESISEHALAQMDAVIFKPSRLDSWRRGKIEADFRAFCEKNGMEPPVLRFRNWPGPPNAFALPYRDVVVTDAMVEFVDGDAELLSVLAHETAHQRNRHVLRQLLRQTGVFVIVSLAAGDATSIVSATATLPSMLVERGYGREFESEADEVGASYMVKAGLGVGPMLSFMEKLAAKYPERGGSDLFSTHPLLVKRIERLRELKEKNGGL